MARRLLQQIADQPRHVGPALDGPDPSRLGGHGGKGAQRKLEPGGQPCRPASVADKDIMKVLVHQTEQRADRAGDPGRGPHCFAPAGFGGKERKAALGADCYVPHVH
jgi:hypothetical protein